MAKIVEFPAPAPTPPFRSMGEAFDWADEQTKLKMIWQVAHMDTLNSINKACVVKMLRYLAELTLEEY